VWYVQFREEEEPLPLQIKHEDGYVREQGVEGEYQTQQKKDGFPLMEKDKYKCYYREYFFSPDKKEDILRTSMTIEPYSQCTFCGELKLPLTLQDTMCT
jgi:hypothetical protein